MTGNRSDDSSAYRTHAFRGGSRPRTRWRLARLQATAWAMALSFGGTAGSWRPVNAAEVAVAPSPDDDLVPEPPPASEPDASTSDCADDSLRRADAKMEGGFTASAAELYEDAYRCLTTRQRGGPRGVSIVMVAVDAYKRTVLQDPELEGMLVRARQLVDEHLRFLEEHPESAVPADERRLEELRAEIELVSVGLRCQRVPSRCASSRSGVGSVALGLSITGSVLTLAGTVFTATSVATLRLIGIRRQDLHAVAPDPLLSESRRTQLSGMLDEQAKGQYLILGLGVAAVVVGGTMLVVGLVHGRRRSQRVASGGPTGFVLHF